MSDSTLKIGPITSETPKAFMVEVARHNGASVVVWIPKSVAEVTREGVPLVKYAWAPHWWCVREGVREYRPERKLFPLAKEG